MILQVVAVFDLATQSYMRPFYVPHVGGAVRGFIDEVGAKDKADSPLAKHPEDYELHHVGQFDDESGKTTNVGMEGVDVVLIRGKDAVRSE